jgi:hypothetical protein
MGLAVTARAMAALVAAGSARLTTRPPVIVFAVLGELLSIPAASWHIRWKTIRTCHIN